MFFYHFDNFGLNCKPVTWFGMPRRKMPERNVEGARRLARWRWRTGADIQPNFMRIELYRCIDYGNAALHACTGRRASGNIAYYASSLCWPQRNEYSASICLVDCKLRCSFVSYSYPFHYKS